MKKTTLENIVAILTGAKCEVTAADVAAEVQAELDRIQSAKDSKKSARTAFVAALAPVIKANLTEPMTSMELFEKIRDEVPEGFEVGSSRTLVYLLTHGELPYEIAVNRDGKKNTYALA